MSITVTGQTNQIDYLTEKPDIERKNAPTQNFAFLRFGWDLEEKTLKKTLSMYVHKINPLPPHLSAKT